MWSVDRPYADGLLDGRFYPDRPKLDRPADDRLFSVDR